MESRMARSGRRPFSRVFGIEYRPYEISETFLEDIDLASRYRSRLLWDEADAALIRGYNHMSRKGREKKYVFVIGVMLGKDPYEVHITHSRIADIFADMDYHLSLVLFPWDDGPDMENYYAALCSPKTPLVLRLTGVNRKRKTMSAVATAADYDGIAPDNLYNFHMVANILNESFGSLKVKKFAPDKEKDTPLEKPKIIKFGGARERRARYSRGSRF